MLVLVLVLVAFLLQLLSLQSRWQARYPFYCWWGDSPGCW
jgi:hypothetical protein